MQHASARCLPRGARGEAPVVSEGALSLYCTAKFIFALAASQDAECATSVGCTWLCVAKHLQNEDCYAIRAHHNWCLIAMLLVAIFTGAAVSYETMAMAVTL